MNQTEHYKLSQWEPSDRVQMEDFNADNAKVETALAGLESRKLEVVTLLDETRTVENAARCDFEFQGIKPWDCLAIFIEVFMPQSTNFGLTYPTAGTNMAHFNSSAAAYVGFPLKSPDSMMMLLPIGGTSEVPTLNHIPYSKLTAVSMRSSTSSGSIAGVLNGTIRCRVTGII